jgi:hypothetical protein
VRDEVEPSHVEEAAQRARLGAPVTYDDELDGRRGG